jgi:hypothetical protein
MDYDNLARQLEATGDFKVLRRFESAQIYAPLEGVDPQQLRVAMVVDTETTGLSRDDDKIIDLGYVLAEFHPRTGLVHRILERYSGFEDRAARSRRTSPNSRGFAMRTSPGRCSMRCASKPRSRVPTW